MSKQRFNVKLTVEMVETVDEAGNAVNKQYFDATPLCYHNVPYEVALAVGKELHKFLGNILEYGDQAVEACGTKKCR